MFDLVLNLLMKTLIIAYADAANNDDDKMLIFVAHSSDHTDLS